MECTFSANIRNEKMFCSFAWYIAVSVMLAGYLLMVWSQESTTKLHHLLRRTTRAANATGELKLRRMLHAQKKLNKTLKFISWLVKQREKNKKENERVITISAQKAKNYRRVSTTNRYKITLKFQGFSSKDIMKFTCTPTKRPEGLGYYRRHVPTPITIPYWTKPRFIL